MLQVKLDFMRLYPRTQPLPPHATHDAPCKPPLLLLCLTAVIPTGARLYRAEWRDLRLSAQSTPLCLIRV